MFGIGNHRRADAAGGLAFGLVLAVLGGADVDVAACNQGNVVLD
ncbi:hypothetical protein [Neisseria weixii]|nr:hypothetical protein [Neisseria weixii]